MPKEKPNDLFIVGLVRQQEWRATAVLDHLGETEEESDAAARRGGGGGGAPGTSLEHVARQQVIDRAAADLATLRLIDEDGPEPRLRECGNDEVRMTVQQNARKRVTLV